jgi:hypothetical protein
MEYPIKRSDVDVTFDSVNLIEETIISESPDTETKKDTVKRNVEHLQIVKAGSYIDLSQFSAGQIASIDAAISKGNTFISSL